MQNIRAHLYIYGDVVGVGFRYWTVGEAKKLGLKGWVKNLSNCVEAVFEGPKNKVERAVSLCYEGPPAGLVKRIDVTWGKAEDNLSDFKIEY